MSFQFQIDGRGFGSPIRANWAQAAQDAVSAGYAIWIDETKIHLDDQAEIARIPDKTGFPRAQGVLAASEQGTLTMKNDSAQGGAGKRAVVQKGGAVATYDYGTDAGAGFEGTQATDLSIPFLAILQSNSPQVESNSPDGSKAGMLFNTVTRELIPGAEGLVFQPCFKEDCYVEWVPRDAGGGLVGRHDAGAEIVKKAVAKAKTRFEKLKTEDGKHDLVETHYVYGLVLDSSGEKPLGFAVISFSSTKIKPFRDWFTAMYMLVGKPPIFANRARIKTVQQTNKKGQKFYNFQVDPFQTDWRSSLIDPAANKELLEAGKNFRDKVMSGAAKAAFETQEAAGGERDEEHDQEGDGPAPF